MTSDGSEAARRKDRGDQVARIDTVIANMERWRWLPHELGAAYVMVNIPDYTLKVVNLGKTVWSTRIVVGKPGNHATPLLAETMKYITFNPTWSTFDHSQRISARPRKRSDRACANWTKDRPQRRWLNPHLPTA
jgi:murein L,D-transpeptidase YcbB/YkuD